MTVTAHGFSHGLAFNALCPNRTFHRKDRRRPAQIRAAPREYNFHLIVIAVAEIVNIRLKQDTKPKNQSQNHQNQPQCADHRSDIDLSEQRPLIQRVFL